MKRRYNYLSHMVDSSTDSVARVAKISAFWATMSQGIVIINLILYLGAGEINHITMIIMSFLFWCSIFGVMIVTQLGWISHLVFNGLDDGDTPFEPSPHPTPTTTTKYYVPTSSGYKIDKVVSRVGGEQDDLTEKG